MICSHCEYPIAENDHYHSWPVFSQKHNKWVSICVHHDCREQYRAFANGLAEYYRRCWEYGENPYLESERPSWCKHIPGFEIESFTIKREKHNVDFLDLWGQG